MRLTNTTLKLVRDGIVFKSPGERLAGVKKAILAFDENCTYGVSDSCVEQLVQQGSKIIAEECPDEKTTSIRRSHYAAYMPVSALLADIDGQFTRHGWVSVSIPFGSYKTEHLEIHPNADVEDTFVLTECAPYGHEPVVSFMKKSLGLESPLRRVEIKTSIDGGYIFQLDCNEVIDRLKQLPEFKNITFGSRELAEHIVREHRAFVSGFSSSRLELVIELDNTYSHCADDCLVTYGGKVWGIPGARRLLEKYSFDPLAKAILSLRLDRKADRVQGVLEAKDHSLIDDSLVNEALQIAEGIKTAFSD